MSQLHVVCPHCHTTNRVQGEDLAKRPTCGRCHEALFSGHPQNLGAAEFDRHVTRSDLPVLVDFWAPWCGPCRQLMPILDRLAVEYGGRFKLAKVNTDEQQQLAQQLGIRSLPTVVLFKDRTTVDHFMGVVPESQIRQMLDRHLPQLSDAPLSQVQKLKSQGDYAGAMTLVQQLLVRDPENISLRTEAAELRALDGDLEGARQALQQLQGGECVLGPLQEQHRNGDVGEMFRAIDRWLAGRV